MAGAHKKEFRQLARAESGPHLTSSKGRRTPAYHHKELDVKNNLNNLRKEFSPRA
jgi:hypothetical protein